MVGIRSIFVCYVVASLGFFLTDSESTEGYELLYWLGVVLVRNCPMRLL